MEGVVFFFAHDIAAWLGIPVAAVIAILLILRKRLRERRARRNAEDRDHSRPHPDFVTAGGRFRYRLTGRP
jgi:hypothetical protein